MIEENTQDDTVHTEDEHTAAASEPAQELPGERLKSAREENHLSQEEVAHHLHLDVKLIVALEENDYEKLPSPSYICGYLRSYARLLKLPESEIVNCYSQGEEISSALLPENVDIVPRRQPSSTSFMPIILLLLVVSGLFAAVWALDFFNKHEDDGSKGVESKVNITTEVDSSVPGEETLDTVSPSAAQTTEPDSNTTPSTTQTDEPDSNTTPSAAQTTEPGSNATPSTAQITEPDSDTIPSTAQKTTEPVEITKFKRNNTVVKSDGNPFTTKRVIKFRPAKLKLAYNGDSWTEINDANGKRLIFRLVANGSNLEVDGEAPFVVLLGNASAVKIYFEGNEFSHTRFHRDNIAYFRIDSAN